jgi:hypothetical protein
MLSIIPMKEDTISISEYRQMNGLPDAQRPGLGIIHKEVCPELLHIGLGQ